MTDAVERHVKEIEWIRGRLLSMDSMINPLMGVRDWDDSVIVAFGGRKLVASVDGPYTKRLVMKSALVHASTDVVVKGARPLFALDSIIGKRADLEDMIGSLKRQSEALGIPILGGNTLIEDVEARCSIAVLGELLLPAPIRDSGARKGDVIALLGEPLWGEQEERLTKALRLFDAWYRILKAGVKINSSKDVTKGGLVSVVYEMEKKSGRKFKLSNQLEFPLTRNMDNFLLTLGPDEYGRLERLCANKCALAEIGSVG